MATAELRPNRPDTLDITSSRTGHGWGVHCNGLPIATDLTSEEEARDVSLAYRLLFHPGFDQGDRVYATMFLKSFTARHDSRRLECLPAD